MEKILYISASTYEKTQSFSMLLLMYNVIQHILGGSIKTQRENLHVLLCWPLIDFNLPSFHMSFWYLQEGKYSVHSRCHYIIVTVVWRWVEWFGWGKALSGILIHRGQNWLLIYTFSLWINFSHLNMMHD